MAKSSELHLDRYLDERRELVARALSDAMEPGPPSSLKEAMRYTLLAPAKRLRAIICLAACELSRHPLSSALPTACAIEMIHAMSLIHDDLPAMDDAAQRRGQPASHVVHGEALAILAGDALLVRAFEHVAARSAAVSADRVLKVIATLASALSCQGLAGGQALDIGASRLEGTPEEILDRLHGAKTAALFRAAAECGAILGCADDELLRRLVGYGWSFGLAFQCADDLLDAVEDGREQGARSRLESRAPMTAVGLLGVEEARLRLTSLIDEAKRHVAPYGRMATPLTALADLCLSRALPSAREEPP